MRALQDHPSFIGCYFPGFSSPASIQHCYEAADAILFVGAQQR
jgi:TPP-dependent 2-oxoacid decarboxylase